MSIFSPSISPSVMDRMNLRSASTWYKDAIIYEVHVRAFYDSVTDGIGDFGGLTQKLGYLEDLGVTAIWLLPFCPSPLRDDGYDISDYADVHPSYGTLKDFQRFLKEARRRGLRVITELVVNHTSEQHVWFQRSRRAAPGSRWRNFYVWSDTADKYRETRIIFKDFETSNWTWDPVAKAYYWHRFYSHQPDLNWDNPEVREAMFAAMDFWLDMGVDGLRLDAVPYLVEREGTNCENLVETHDALRELRAHVDEKYSDRMLLAEANQWPEDSVAYFGNGDECHMAFHFPVMPRLFMSLRMEDRHPLTDILRLTPPIPENCQWALFLRNHDELTLEMVTDEERDYMYRTYAHDREMRINLGIRRRLAPLLENDRRKIELMNGLLFSLPGTPVVYYGDEIGMGDNVYLGDRNGVRTPMQWSADRNAGFSRANPQRLYLPVNIDPEYHYEAVNVEAQQNNSHSLLWWMKRMIAQRKQFKAFGRGSLEFLYPSNRKVLAFVRQYDDEKILVVANLSRFTQAAELDLSKHQGLVPVEVFGRNRFPSVGEQPYFMSLGPYAFYWFHLQPQQSTLDSISVSADRERIPVLTVDTLDGISPATRSAITRLTTPRLKARPWFLAKNRTIRQVTVRDVIQLGESSASVVLIEIDYTDGDPEMYVISLSIAAGEAAEELLRDKPEVVLARLQSRHGMGVLYSSIFDRKFSATLLSGVVRRRKFKGQSGYILAGHTAAFRKPWSQVRSNLEPMPQRGDHHNTSINFGEDFVLKLYRKVEPGANPDRELEEFLTEHTDLACIPHALGWIDYRRAWDDQEESTTLGLLTRYVRNATNGWTYTLDQLGLFFERALAISNDDARLRELASGDPLSLASQHVPALVAELMGNHLEVIGNLGRRTAELHAALSSRPEIPDFAPEPFTDFYRHSLYHGMLGQVSRSFEALRARLRSLSPIVQDGARALLDRETDVRSQFHALRDERIVCTRIRHHGDYHLGQILFTVNDVVITNFEGDPRRPMSERRIKRASLRDVTSMIRSFHYASHAVLLGQVPGIVVSGDSQPHLERWAEIWYQWASAVFLDNYLQSAGNTPFIPATASQLRTLFRAYLIDKALMEIAYELEHRSGWIMVPVHGLMNLIGER
ncbi:MAG TPA: maltose alpha-D-glucosyltransferase [Terriglobales bacterium]|nr:maltose alpha-D-glucosyltransferase [Terriglobales bacterium]